MLKIKVNVPLDHNGQGIVEIKPKYKTNKVNNRQSKKITLTIQKFFSGFLYPCQKHKDSNIPAKPQNLRYIESGKPNTSSDDLGANKSSKPHIVKLPKVFANNIPRKILSLAFI